MKGELVWMERYVVSYAQPVAINDHLSAIRHHSGWLKEGTPAVVLSNPDDWREVAGPDVSAPWTQVLVGDRVIWVPSEHLVRSPLARWTK